MNESSFSQWLCNHLKKQGLFPQRLEVTTGAGIPDLAVLGIERQFDTEDTEFHSHDPRAIHIPRSFFKTAWIELKWKTNHIRPEQYVWGKKALDVGVCVNYVVGSEETIDLYSIHDAKPMKNSFKLTELVASFPRNHKHIEDLILSLL